MKNKFIVLVGPPAIGKSTYTKNVLSPLEPEIISRDDIVEEVSNENGLTYNEYYQRLGDPDLANLREKVEFIVQNKFKEAVDIVEDQNNKGKWSGGHTRLTSIYQPRTYRRYGLK